MLVEKIGEGNTIEEALENAKVLLNAPDDVLLQQEILQFPKKKLFGLKTEPAKVKVWYEMPDPVPEKKSTPASVKTTAPAPEKKPAPVNKTEPTEKKLQTIEKKPENKPTPERKTEIKPVVEKKTEPKPAAKKTETKTEAPVQVPVKETQTTVQKETKPLTKTLIPVDDSDEAVAYLKSIIFAMGIESCEVILEKCEETGELIYTLDCGKADGALIGRRGETLDAIQYLLRLSVNKGVEDDKHSKISVNIGNYREKRNDNLRQLAAKHARQVLKYGRSAKLEPMNPYERRIIHTAIQGIEGVTSHSVGSDSNRRVIISLAEGVQPTNPAKGYNNNRTPYNKGGKSGFGNRNGYNKGGKGGYQKKEPYKPSVTREPRKDTAGSLYGKIEIPAKNEEE